MTGQDSESLTLRKTNDFEGIRALSVRSGLEDGPFQNVVEAYGFFFHDELVGCATLKIDRQAFSVEWLAVKDGMRLRGLGTQLVEAIENEARKRGANRIWALARAPAFFQKMGFSKTREDALGRPPMASCRTCRQYGKTCHPEMMVKSL